MGDSWTSDLLGIYIEKEFSRKIPINDIVEGFIEWAPDVYELYDVDV